MSAGIAGIGATMPGGVPPISVAPYRTRSATAFQTSIAAGASAAVLTLTGAGVVLGFQLSLYDNTSSTGTAAKSAVVKITADGASSPQITFDAGTLGAWFPTAAVARACEHMQVQVPDVQDNAITWRYPIFFSNGLTIEVDNVSTTDELYAYSDSWYSNDVQSPLRLYGEGLVTSAAATLTETENYTWLTRAAGKSGWIVGHALSISGASNLTYLFRTPQALVNGEASASYQTSSTEDWITGSFLFAISPQSSPWHYNTVAASSGDSNSFLDLLRKHGGLQYTDGITLEWVVNSSSPLSITTSCTMTYLTLYYE